MPAGRLEIESMIAVQHATRLRARRTIAVLNTGREIVKKQIQRLPRWRNSGNLIARNLWPQSTSRRA